MEFTQAQYEAVIDKLNSALAELQNKLAQLRQAAQAAVDGTFPAGSARDAVVWVTNQLIGLGTSLIARIQDLLKGAVAPVRMYFVAYDWQDLRAKASTVAGELKPDVLDSGRQWAGAGHDAYARSIKPQGDAAARIVTIADKTSGALTTCAGFGLAFYAGIAVIVAKFTAATVTAILAFGSAVFSWAGAAIIVEEAGINTAMLIAAGTTLTAALGAQAAQLAVLHGEASDNSVFPGGHWPAAVTAAFAG